MTSRLRFVYEYLFNNQYSFPINSISIIVHITNPLNTVVKGLRSELICHLPVEVNQACLTYRRRQKIKMEGKERFAKCFVMIVENCKSWSLEFAENRIQQKNGQTLEQFINSTPDVLKAKMVTEFLKNRKTSSSSEIDIAALCVVIFNGKLLARAEWKSVGHQNNTIGDLIERIQQLRNTFVHIGEANLDESEYDDYINNFKDIGQHFEVINGKRNGTYTNEIEEIHDTLFDTSKVERIVVSYEKYVNWLWTIEIPGLLKERSAPVEERPAPAKERKSKDCRCYHCRHGHPTDCKCYHCRHYRIVICQCYHCCHHFLNGCPCVNCLTKSICFIM